MRPVDAIVDNFRLALSTFWGHRLRSLLTLLGIVIGAATVVSMMALLEGLRLKVNDDLTGLGSNGFQIQKFPNGFGNIDFEKLSKRPNLTVEDREDIQRRAPDVVAVTGEGWEFGAKISNDRYETRPNVVVAGGTGDVFTTNAQEIAQGRAFSEAEVSDGQRLIVLGADVSDVLFPGINPLGQEVRMRTRPFRVIGVIKRKGAFIGGFTQDNVVVTTLPAFFELFGKKRSLNISMQAASTDVLQKAMEEVRQLMRRRHNRRRIGHPGLQPDFQRHHRGELWGLPALAHRRRHRHSQHHAGLGHRTDRGDRRAEGAGSTSAPDPGTVRHRGSGAVAGGGRPGGAGRFLPGVSRPLGGGARLGHELGSRSGLRDLSGRPCRPTRPGRGHAR
jgi:MacB-like protein